MSEVVPEGWRVSLIENIGSFYSGLTGKTSKDFGEGTPFLNYMQVFKRNLKNDKNIGLVKLAKGEKQNRVQQGDILFTTSSETPDEVGMTAVFLDDDWSPYLNSFCFGLRPKKEFHLYPEFADHSFRGNAFRERMRALAQGSTRYNLSKENLKKLDLLLPPLPEQKQIAAILTSVDEVIESTQKQIDKLQDLKKATMIELLTKGISHTEFKDSELGRIPKSWEVRRLDDVTIRGSGHTPDKKNLNYWNGGIKWVSLADSSSLDNRLIGATDKEISAEGLENSSAVLHPDGTVILSRDAGVGKSAVLLGDMAVSQHFMVWRCGDKMEKWFLYYLLQSLKPLFETVAIGSTIKTIGLGFFKQMKIVYPPMDEQRQISSILLVIEDHIDNMKHKLTQTQALKNSLMQVLLTGKVRVKVN